MNKIKSKCLQFRYKAGLSDTYRREGILFTKNGLHDSAIHAYLNAYQYSLEANDILSQASNLNQVASVYNAQKNAKQALNYYRTAFTLYAVIPDYRGMSDAMFNISEIQFNDGMIDSSYILCLESLGYMRRWGDTSTVGYNYDLLSRIKLRQAKPQEALRYSSLAVELLRKDNDYPGLLPALIQFGKIHRRLNTADSAKKHFNEAFIIASSLGYKQNLPELAGLLANLYEQKGFQDSAVKYLKLKQAFSDSLNNEVRERITSEMLTRFDTERKEADLLHEKERLASQKTMNIILLSLSLVLLLSLLLIWRSFRQQKRIRQKESELNQANALLRGQDEERGRIARELHDRIGSMISTIKLHFSAMEEQMNSLTKEHRNYEKAISLLDETYEEVRRISHDLDTGVLGRFGLRTAMFKLIQLIQSTNKLQMQYIDNNLEPELYKRFEADLYRITQELLSNTIKYAGAREVSIQLSRNNENLVYSYEDDGRGFDRKLLEQSPGLGYRNISARVQKMKGLWHLDTSTGHGLTLIIEIPLSENKDYHR